MLGGCFAATGQFSKQFTVTLVDSYFESAQARKFNSWRTVAHERPVDAARIISGTNSTGRRQPAFSEVVFEDAHRLRGFLHAHARELTTHEGASARYCVREKEVREHR